MPWLRIPFGQEERRRKLARALDVQAIPTLVILDPRDNIVTLDGRAELIEDPEGLVNENFLHWFSLFVKASVLFCIWHVFLYSFQNFPWTSRLVNILTEKYATSLHDAPAIILFVGKFCIHIIIIHGMARRIGRILRARSSNTNHTNRYRSFTFTEY